MLHNLLEACQTSCGPLLEATLTPQSGLTGYSLLGNAILAEIDEALAEGLPGELTHLPACMHGFLCVMCM